MGCVTLIASGSHPWKKAATWGGQKRERWRFETELFKKCLWTVLGQCKLVFYFYLLIFEIGLHSTKCWSWTHYVVEVGLKVLILLSLPPEFWDYNYAPPPGCDLVFFLLLLLFWNPEHLEKFVAFTGMQECSLLEVKSEGHCRRTSLSERLK